MKRFIINTAVFFALIVVLAMAVDAMISKGLTLTERGHFYTMNALMNKKMDADVVVLGNSRAVCSYNPCVLDN